MKLLKRAVRPARPFSSGDLLGIFACVVLALAPQAGSVPAWVLAVSIAAGALRLGLAHRRRPPPPFVLRLVLAVASVAILFLQFRTFNGLTAGTALLALMAGLKLLESERPRDIYVVSVMVYFLVLSSLLLSDSFALLAYSIALCGLTTAAQLRLATAAPLPGWPWALRYCGKLLAQAAPLALGFWLFFPRFAGPLWQLPSDGETAGTGLSDTMSPGDITRLVLSDDIAFRVRFDGATPPVDQLYWRGPVLHEFDGRTWRRGRAGASHPPATIPAGPAYAYTLSLEPHQHEWLFALDWPSRWDAQGGGSLTWDYTLVQRLPVTHPLDIRAVSHTQVDSPGPLSKLARSKDSGTAAGRNPRTLELARSLRRAHPDDAEFIRAVLDMFAHQSFYYTLNPPRLADDSVDAFLFDTRRGFCGHYASAFALLMRSAGLPAHVVTGYHGGAFNRFAGYWIVRQSEAHAWDEVWLEGRGWVRFDPTSVIAPERVDPETAAAAESGATGRWRRQAAWMSDLRLRLDALRLLWRERILLFDQGSQEALLEAMHIPEPDGRKLVLVLAGMLTLVFAWLTWSLRRELTPEGPDPLRRAYARLCGTLARAGLPRRPYEGAEDYAARVGRERPDLEPRVAPLLRQYSRLRYGRAPSAAEARDFGRSARAFRAGRRTGS